MEDTTGTDITGFTILLLGYVDGNEEDDMYGWLSITQENPYNR